MSPPRKRERAPEREAAIDVAGTYLLDTDALADLVRRPGGSVAQRIAEVGEERVVTSLVAAGTPIGPNGLWIAAHALALGATVVTGNEREFRRVRGLNVENWLAA